MELMGMGRMMGRGLQSLDRRSCGEEVGATEMEMGRELLLLLMNQL
jgi:hypothetical protein